MMKKLGILLMALLMLPCAFAEEAAPILEVHQMVLGYADGYYIRCGDVEIMIDGGKPVPFAENDDVLNNLRALGADKLDMYIITHWHMDHCENFNEVLAAYGTPETMVYSPSEQVPKTVDNGVNKNRTLAMLPMANGVYQQMKVDDVIRVGDLTITCIGPENISQKGKCNADSLNFVIQYGTRRFLFTGDYAQSGEINQRYLELCSNVDVLKFPHHGSLPYLIGDRAARNVSPDYVLIPSSESGYKVWEFLVKRGVDIKRENVLNYNTGGHVVILTDGGDYLEARTQQNPADYAPKAN